MPFIVEDGTGLSTANSYASVEEADLYWVDRGIPDIWGSSTQNQKEQALVKATDHVEKVYGSSWIGIRATDTQFLGWPRKYAYSYSGVIYSSTEVPIILKQAICEYALRSFSGALIPDAVDASSISTKREKVGPIEIETRFDTDHPLPMYHSVDLILRSLLRTDNKVYR